MSKAKTFGTGFIITKDGYIVTCQHVVEEAAKIKVAIGETVFPARVILEDKNNDIALLKINGKFVPLAFAPERTTRLGQDIFTLGFPNPELQGVSPKLTKGAISGLTGVQDDVRLYQISAPVQPGNSGGPLLDNNGNITGVVVAMLNAAAAFKFSGSLPQNVNYALKSSYAQALLDSVPDVVNNLPGPAKNEPFDTMVKRVTKGIVMIVVY
jgi:S1-C subfamily serine protease